MANRSFFQSLAGRFMAPANTHNSEQAPAYALSSKQALAQSAATGCFNATFYASVEEQFDAVLAAAAQVEPEFLAKLALFARQRGKMKDMPALLVAVLSTRSPGLMAEVFDRVIDSPKMLRNFVQIMRSGRVGRKSLGTLPKRLVLQWLEQRSEEQLFRGSVGTTPSLADVIRMVHPKPSSAVRAALYGYLVGRPHDASSLPELVQKFEAFKIDPSAFVAEDMPEVPMEMLTALPLTTAQWAMLAERASWQSLRMNLNAFARHGVFESQEAVARAATRLADPFEIERAGVFPYQLLAAFANVDGSVPSVLKNALQDAMEIAISNVPTIAGRVWVFVDVSGSMQSPVTGHRAGATTSVRCVDVAALVAAAVLRKNPGANVLAFSDDVVPLDLNPRDSIMTNASKMSALPSGGTNCSAPLRELNRRGMNADLVIYVSDNESWVDAAGGSRGTATMAEWTAFQKRNPRAKLVCVDVQPNHTTQAYNRTDILNIGGFSDAVFEVIAEFANGSVSADHWVGVIERERI